MLWFLYSLLSAFFNSIFQALSKHGAQRIDEYSAAWSHRFFAVLILIPLVIITRSFHPINSLLWLVLLIITIINTYTSILFFNALKIAPLSLVLPIMAFTPAFLLITAPIINQESPTLLGIIGVILVVIGSYVLNLSKRSRHPLAPLTSIFEEPGPRQMFITAFLFAISINVVKIGLEHSNPLFLATLISATLLLSLSIVLLYKKISFSKVLRHAKTLAPIGIASAAGLTFQMAALELNLVANVIAVKRTSILFGIVWGKVFFKEEKIKERLLGASIMILGVILITFS